MKAKSSPRYLCDNCSASLASAILDNEKLCSGCLMRALLSSADSELFKKIARLDSTAPQPSAAISQSTLIV